MSNNPSPSEMLAAFLDHGVDVKTYARWDTRGGRWGQNGGGLDGITMHHTATRSATGSQGAPSLYWCANTYDWAISNMLIGRGPGDTYLLSANPSYHTGLGGPFPDIGIRSAGNVGHLQLFGIEIDDPGTALTLTDYQIENAARVAAALWDLCDWPTANRIITHQAWTDGSYGVNPAGPSPYLGRKGDTMHRAWREFPGSTKAENYNPVFWREKAAGFRKSNETWDGTVPKRSAVQRADRENLANLAAWRVACRLFDLGFRNPAPRPAGRQNYPAAAVIQFQKAHGLETSGNFDAPTQRKMFGKLKR